MKKYIIWLRSGECIEGTVEDDIANKLILDSKRFSRLKFKDSEGYASVKRSRIEAIAIIDVVEANRCGF